jgi:hypothetical protein
MAELENSKDRRRSPRVAAGKGALAFNGKQYGQIVDASLEGLCFQYISRRKGGTERNASRCKASNSLDIVFGAHDFTLVDLPVTPTADYEIFSPQDQKTGVNIRRRILTFGDLTSHQLFLLKRFLLLNRHGNSPPPHKAGQ